MTSAAFALQEAIFETLTTTAAVTSALGGPRVYDDVPVHSEFPFLTFGPATARDWSTGSDHGHEHFVALNVWSRRRGRKEVEAIVDAVETALHDAALGLSGHRLINLRHEASEIRRDGDGETFAGVVRFRAVTEVI